MQLALVGLPGTGVKTIFSAVTGFAEAAGAFSAAAGQHRLAVLKVPDERLQRIAQVYKPKKTTPATVEIAEYPGLFGQKIDSRLLAKVREADALGLVIRSFSSMTAPHLQGSVDAQRDLRFLLSEMLLSDLGIVENRLERLSASIQKRKNEEEETERDLLVRCKELLDSGQRLSELSLAPGEGKRIRGFGFLTRKPLIILLNIGDSQLGQEQELLAPFESQGWEARAICADIEAELARMSAEERAEFMEDLGIEQLAAPVVLAAAYRILDAVTFFTYSEEECRAWTVRAGETAVDAAGKIHTDLARGFIRAEVVGFADFQEHGDVKGAKAAGKFRLEGKDYVVQEGDLILIRHSG